MLSMNLFCELTSLSLLFLIPRTKSVRFLSNILSRFPLTFFSAILFLQEKVSNIQVYSFSSESEIHLETAEMKMEQYITLGLQQLSDERFSPYQQHIAPGFSELVPLD